MQKIVETAKPVWMLSAIAPSSTTPDYVSLKNYQHATLIITVENGTGVTGSAITLKQAQAVAGTSEKALAFANMWSNVDCAAADVLAKTDVTSDTFTTASTSSKLLMYVIEVDASELDTDNAFDCVRVGTGDATRATVSILGILGAPRFAAASMPAAITD